MEETQVLTFCVLCQEACISFVLSDREFFFCNNSECPRFGLLTAITTPIGNPPQEFKDEIDKHKKIQ